jgi:hypothetical protein
VVEPQGLSHPEIDYERRDLPLKPLALTALALIVLLGSAPLIILAGFRSTAHDVDRRLTVLPPAPRLQIHPREDLEAYLARERALMDSYGWIDRSRGIAHVPIAVEMKRLARQGIPGFAHRAPQEGQGARPGGPP